MAAFLHFKAVAFSIAIKNNVTSILLFYTDLLPNPCSPKPEIV